MCTIKQLREEKLKTEKRISIAVSAIVDDFMARTGLDPSYINIDMVDVSTIGSDELRHVVGETSIEVRI